MAKMTSGELARALETSLLENAILYPTGYRVQPFERRPALWVPPPPCPEQYCCTGTDKTHCVPGHQETGPLRIHEPLDARRARKARVPWPLGEGDTVTPHLLKGGVAEEILAGKATACRWVDGESDVSWSDVKDAATALQARLCSTTAREREQPREIAVTSNLTTLSAIERLASKVEGLRVRVEKAARRLAAKTSRRNEILHHNALVDLRHAEETLVARTARYQERVARARTAYLEALAQDREKPDDLSRGRVKWLESELRRLMSEGDIRELRG